MNEFPTPTGTRVLADRYVLHQPIGSGGAGVVWRAHDRVLDRTVAVKLLHPDVAADPRATARFRDEASAAAKLTHPNAVILYDIGQAADGDYLVMELVEGGTLEDLLDSRPLAPDVAAALGAQVGRALGAAHDSGLVHRDVKPANILITVDGVAKVTDFGIARALGETTSRLTSPGHVVGTARYLAPEQLRDQTIDSRADVYSLGLLLHHAITGRPPFGDGSAVEVAMRRFADTLPRLSEYRTDVPAALDEAIAKATRLDPADRYADGGEFAGVLSRLANPAAARELAARVARDVRTDEPAAAPAGATPPAATVDGASSGHTAVLDASGPPVLTGAGDAPIDADVTAETAADTRPSPLWIVLAAAVVIGIAATLIVSSLDDDRAQSVDDLVAEPTDTDRDDPEPEPIEVVDGGDHDPFGSGEEHADDVANAFDGDDTTVWQTQRYRGNPELGGLKPGVGIWLDLGDALEVAEVQVSMTTAGASFTVYAGDAPPEAGVSPDDWGSAVASIDDADEQTTAMVDEPTEARVWLLWLTSLPPEGDQFRAVVAEVGFAGPEAE